MRIVQAEAEQQKAWIALRNQLWPGDPASHKQEVAQILSEDSEIAFLLIGDHGEVHGFVEGKYYQAKDQRYGHVEGWFVELALIHATANFATFRGLSINDRILCRML